MHFSAEKAIDETTFPFKIDVPVWTNGFLAVLGDMVLWCNRHAAPWVLHSHSAKSRNFARFYFKDRQVAAQFAQRWGAART